MSDAPTGMIATVSLRAGPLDCWDCGCETTIITGIDLIVGPECWQLSVADFDKFPDLFDTLRRRIPDALGIGAIKSRFGRTQGRSYLSNGCVHCDALIGQFLEHPAWARQESIGAFPVQLTARWRQAVAAAIGEEPGGPFRDPD